MVIDQSLRHLSTKYLKPSAAAQKAGVSEIVLGWTNRHRYYAVVTGENVVEWPAWQFDEAVDNVHLEQVIAELTQHPKTLLHTFFVSGDDNFNELSPAEMLAGIPFMPGALTAPQERLLSLRPGIRLCRVLVLARQYVSELKAHDES